MTTTLISAFKRKNIKDILVEVLTLEGKDEQAKEVFDAGRITSALIDRTCADADAPEEALPEFAEQAVEDAECCVDEEGTVNELIAIDTDIKALLAKGKGKKALKLIKSAMEMGVKGSVIKEQMKQAKALKKESK